MPEILFASETRPDPRLARTLWQALIVGALLCLAVPPLRGHNVWLGWMPFWLVLAPGLALLLAHRRRLLPRPVRAPAPVGRRQRRATASQARRTSPGRRQRWRGGSAAGTPIPC